MFVNIFLIFIFDFKVRKIMQNPKPYIIYMNVTERSENTPAGPSWLRPSWPREDLTQSDLTSGRVDRYP